MLVNKDTIILKRPERGFNLRKLFSFISVLFFWFVTLYFMRSLFLVFGWTIIYVTFGRALQNEGFYHAARAVATFYLPLIVLCSFVLYAWAGYNRFRYGGKHDKRRVHPPYLTLEQIADYTHFSIPKIQKMRNSKIVICHFNERRELSDVDCFGTIEQDVGEESIEDLVEVDCYVDLIEVDCYLTLDHRKRISPPPPALTPDRRRERYSLAGAE